MKKIYFCLIFFCFVFGVYAQKKVDKIQLKNNELIIGKIIEQKDSISVKIETEKNNITTIPWSDIVTIQTNTPRFTSLDKTHKRNLELYDVLAKGFTGDLSLPGYQYLRGSMLNFYLSVGYQINPYVAVMGGFGVEALKGTYMPLFADIRFNLLARKATPFIFIRPGYALTFIKVVANSSNGYKGSSYDGGFPYLGAGIGFKYKFLKHLGINIKAGYRFGYANYSYESVDNYIYNTKWNSNDVRVYQSSYQHAINFNLGFEF